jgi:hypothetical protein
VRTASVCDPVAYAHTANYAHAHTDNHAYAHTDNYANTHADGYSNSNSHSNSNANNKTWPDTKAASRSAASPDTALKEIAINDW